MGNIPSCCSGKIVKSSEFNLFADGEKGIIKEKEREASLEYVLPNCLCVNENKNLEEVLETNLVNYLDMNALEEIDNDLVIKKFCEFDNKDPRLDSLVLTLTGNEPNLSEYDQRAAAKKSAKSEPLRRKTGKLIDPIPYEKIPRDQSSGFCLGEILSRSKLKDLDMRELIEGVKYPATDFLILNDKSIYRGELNSEFMPHGRGALFLPDSSIYLGFFTNGKPKGSGKFLNSEKTLSEGDFITINSEKSTFNGNSFVLHGYGIESWMDGTVYEGDFHMGSKQGKGKLVMDGVFYEGEFYNDLFNGEGSIRYENGDVFTGEWKDGLKHGNGEFNSKNGKCYKGTYENDEKCGEGIMVWPDKRKYVGGWKNGKRHGVGLYTFFDKSKARLRTVKSEWAEGEKLRWLSPSNND